MDKKIGFIGAGNMASTIINGLVNSFKDINNKIYVTDINKEKVEKLRDGLNINLCENNTELVKRCDIIFLAIKPNAYQSVLKEIKSYMNNEKLIISMMAGVTIDDIKQYFKQPVKIIRIMPNVGVTVNEGMIALNGGDNVTREEIDLAVELLSSIGRVDEIEEHLMDAVTNISGCSPAYIAMFVEALADGSVLRGMPRDKAYIYAAQTLIGTGKMILEKGIHPGELKDLVSSPAGVTIEGVYNLEKRGFRSIIMETMDICDKKMKS
ncbi:MAG: pyrroline-5-carboxylate reductase [Natronincolaceae bacterium]|jgi:pyrroline-5-carboxylate reductase|nr:pyrroline-5-carboxylate reductase [Bacillota bacterium]NLK90024.1 pyrroline-5-carboxylate reductase [Clostridiales bacterium]